MARQPATAAVAWGRPLVAADLTAAGVTARPVVVQGGASGIVVRRSAHKGLLVLGPRGAIG